MRLCIVQLSCCKWDPKTRGRLGDCSPHAIYYNTYWEQISYRRMPYHQPPSSLGSSPPLLFPPPLSHTSMSELLCVIAAGTPRFFQCRMLMSYGVDMFLQLCLPSCTHIAAGDILLLPAPQDAALPPELMGFPHSSTQPRLRHITGPKLGEAHVDVDVGDTKLHRAKKEQLSTSCTL